MAEELQVRLTRRRGAAGAVRRGKAPVATMTVLHVKLNEGYDSHTGWEA